MTNNKQKDSCKKSDELKNRIEIKENETDVTIIKQNTNLLNDSEDEKISFQKQIHSEKNEDEDFIQQDENSVTENSEDEDFIDAKIDLIQKQVNSLLVEFQILKNDKNWIANFQQKNNKYKKKQAEPVKDVDQLKQMVEQRIEQMEQLKEEMIIELKRLQRQDFQAKQNYQLQTENLKFILDQFNNFQIRIDQTDQLQQIILKILKINHALTFQDEQDRKDIYLFGAKEPNCQVINKNISSSQTYNDKSLMEKSIDREFQSFYSKEGSTDGKKIQDKKKREFNGFNAPKVKSSQIQQHKILKFDNNCLSCSAQGQSISQIPQLIKAFKLACLNYKSSPVTLNNQIYERQKLIDANGCLIYLAVKQNDGQFEDNLQKNMDEDQFLKDLKSGYDLQPSIQSLISIQTQLGFNTDSEINNQLQKKNSNAIYSQKNLNIKNLAQNIFQNTKVQQLQQSENQQFIQTSNQILNKQKNYKNLKLAQQISNMQTINKDIFEQNSFQQKYLSSKKNQNRASNMSSIESILKDNNNNYKISRISQQMDQQNKKIQTFDEQFNKNSVMQSSNNKQIFYNYSQKSISPTRNKNQINEAGNFKKLNQNSQKQLSSTMEDQIIKGVSEFYKQNKYGQNQSPQNSQEMNSTLRLPIMPTIRPLLTTRAQQFDFDLQNVQLYNQLKKQEDQINSNNQIISRNLSMKDTLQIDQNQKNRIGTFRRINQQNCNM